MAERLESIDFVGIIRELTHGVVYLDTARILVLLIYKGLQFIARNKRIVDNGILGVGVVDIGHIGTLGLARTIEVAWGVVVVTLAKVLGHIDWFGRGNLQVELEAERLLREGMLARASRHKSLAPNLMHHIDITQAVVGPRERLLGGVVAHQRAVVAAATKLHSYARLGTANPVAIPATLPVPMVALWCEATVVACTHIIF